MVTRTPRTAFTPAGDQMANMLAKTGGTLTPLKHGMLMKVDAGVWDMARPWYGRELTQWKMRYSLWDKGIHVDFGYKLNATGSFYVVFKLDLAPPMTEEDVAQTADTYMMILNMRRVDRGNT